VAENCYPNRLYGNGEIGAVVVVQGKQGTDYALSVAGLDYVVKAEAEGRIKEGFVALAKMNGNRAFLLSVSKRRCRRSTIRRYKSAGDPVIIAPLPLPGIHPL
jgi:hypothetical protein